MLKRVLSMSTVAGLVVLAAACSGGGSDDGPGFGKLDPDVHKVASVQKLDRFERAISVSPTGGRIAYRAGAGLCVAKLDGSQQQCVPGKVVPDLLNFQWSPDGTKLAFTDDFFRTFHDPDVWVLDAGKRSVTDLTDDGVSELVVGKNSGDSNLDLFPFWSKDSATVYFVRTRKLGGGTKTLMSVPAAGGDAKKVGEFTTTSTLDAFAASPDRKRVAWTEGSGTETRTYVADFPGTDAQKVSGTDGSDNSILRFSADSEYLLMDNLQFSYTHSNPPSHVVKTDVTDAHAIGTEATGATWSQSGHRLLYLQNAAPRVLSDPGGSARKLPGSGGLGLQEAYPVWSDINTVVYYRHGTAVLLTLG